MHLFKRRKDKPKEKTKEQKREEAIKEVTSMRTRLEFVGHHWMIRSESWYKENESLHDIERSNDFCRQLLDFNLSVFDQKKEPYYLELVARLNHWGINDVEHFMGVSKTLLDLNRIYTREDIDKISEVEGYDAFKVFCWTQIIVFVDEEQK